MAEGNTSPEGRSLSAEDYIADNMQHLAKLEAVGQLASGIAHDFNNVLSCMIGFAELSMRSLPPDHESMQYMRLLIEKATGASEFVQQLLAFTSDESHMPEAVDINLAIDSTVKFIQRYLGEHISITLDLASDLPKVNASATALNQILMNLCINARDAMPEGGDLKIATHLIRENHASRDDQSQQQIEVIVSDTGTGIPENVLSQIFNPFYTTKSVGQGTGLGLFIVKSLLEKIGGSISCQSTIAHGTIFRIRLAITESAPSEIQETVLPLRGNGTILVAEDDDDFRKILAEVLRRQGYQVITARNGRQGLSAILNYPGDVDLIVTDMYMPEMSGLALCQFFNTEDQKIEFLLMSGQNEGHVEDFRFIQKPFHIADLLKRVYQLLDLPAAASKPAAG